MRLIFKQVPHRRLAVRKFYGLKNIEIILFNCVDTWHISNIILLHINSFICVQDNIFLYCRKVTRTLDRRMPYIFLSRHQGDRDAKCAANGRGVAYMRPLPRDSWRRDPAQYRCSLDSLGGLHSNRWLPIRWAAVQRLRVSQYNLLILRSRSPVERTVRDKMPDDVDDIGVVSPALPNSATAKRSYPKNYHRSHWPTCNRNWSGKHDKMLLSPATRQLSPANRLFLFLLLLLLFALGYIR